MAVMARRAGDRRRRCVAGGRGGGLRVPHGGRQDGMCLLCGFKTRMRWSLFEQKAASCFAFMWAGFRLNSFIHHGFAFRPPCTQTRVARYLSTSAARTAAAPQATQERRFSSARTDFAVRAAVAHASDTARACRFACAIGHGRRARHLDSGSRATSRSRAHQ